MAKKEKVNEISRGWKIDRNGEESELEMNAPFESFADNFFKSGLLFGQAEDMHPEWYAEAARRVLIMADLILDRFRDHIGIYLDGDESDRPGVSDKKIPPRDMALGELERRGWSISEYKRTIRRLMRVLIKMAEFDSGGRFKEEKYAFHGRRRNILPNDRTDQRQQESESKDDSDKDSEDENFIDDEQNFSGEKAAYYTDCLRYYQADSVDSFAEIREIVQFGKRSREEMEGLQAESTRLALNNAGLKQSAEQREHEERMKAQQLELARLAQQLELARFAFETEKCQAESAKSQSAPATVGTINMVRSVGEKEFEIKHASDWAGIVRLMEEIRKQPTYWPHDRIERQFSESIQFEMELHLKRCRNQNKLPVKLAGFDTKGVGGKTKLFFRPEEGTTFGDILEAYLKAQERDKLGKAIHQSKGTTALTGTFRRWVDSGVTKKGLGLTNDVGNGVFAEKAFKEVADRYELLKSERQWNEEQKQFVRVPTDPSADEAKVAQE